jgi:hypothetical protein
MRLTNVKTDDETAISKPMPVWPRCVVATDGASKVQTESNLR